MRRVSAILPCIAAAFALQGQAHAQTCTASSCTSFIDVEDGHGINVYRSYDLTSGSSLVRRLIFVVHGSGRNAYGVFSNVVRVADSEGKLSESLVVSPLFKTLEDSPGAEDLYWSDGGWKRGDESYGPQVSSFEVADVIVGSIVESGRFPSLELVTVVGHSAGGQFTQRYAAGNEAQNRYLGLKFNYVVMNPSSYLYMNPYRPVPGTVDRFAVPSSCRNYDHYKYGLVERNAYMDRLPAEDLISQYLLRHVTYMVGSDDLSRTNDLDTSCSADAQGSTRYERGVAYSHHIEQHYPDNYHSLRIVPGVGHSAYGMSSSAEGRSAILPDPRSIPRTGEAQSVPMPPVSLEAS